MFRAINCVDLMWLIYDEDTVRVRDEFQERLIVGEKDVSLQNKRRRKELFRTI